MKPHVGGYLERKRAVPGWCVTEIKPSFLVPPAARDHFGERGALKRWAGRRVGFHIGCGWLSTAGER